MRAVIAAATADDVIVGAIEGRAGIGTVIQPRAHRLPARKLWIAFAQRAQGRIVVDDGARQALVGGGKSLLPAGVCDVVGDFLAEAPVEVVGLDGVVFAKGLVTIDASRVRAIAGMQTKDLDEASPHEVIHRDDLVVLPQ